jgi:hypothetical protein
VCDTYLASSTRKFETTTGQPHNYNDQVEEDEMGRACRKNGGGGEEECIKDIGGQARREETTGKTKT